jgi:hypothetical protein
MVRLSRIALVFLVIAFLAGSAPAYAEEHHGGNLTLTFSGGILSSGNQRYSHDGGTLVGALISGSQVDPSKAHLDYSLRAHVSGLDVGGEADFSLSYRSTDSSVTKVTGSAQIGDMIPAEVFPVGCTGTGCSSAIPGAFLGLTSVTVQSCPSDNQQSGDTGSGGWNRDEGGQGHGGCTVVSQSTIPMVFESAFLNPFGGPIFMADEGPGGIGQNVLIVATYSHARVVWSGIQLGGSATGSLDGNPVAGHFSMTVSAVEDLKAGFELETGSIALVGMTPDSLNAAGHFTGKSTIPPGPDCSALFGIPNTCQITGFESKGAFSMEAGSGASVVGSYTTEWTAPAVMFTSSVTATVSSGHGHDGSG